MKATTITSSNSTPLGLVPPPPIVSFPPYEQFGLSVGLVQRLLVFYQQLDESTVDGYYDTMTQNAVERFQLNMRLMPDGIVGSQTWIALANRAITVGIPNPPILHLSLTNVVNLYPNDLPQLSKIYPADPHAYLSVAVLQSLLTSYGYLPSAASVDGCFGNATNEAVMNFQQAMNIEVDGIVAPQTWAALINMDHVPAN